MNREIEQRIKKILIDELRVKREIAEELESDTPLLGKGVGLDSMETLSLVTGLEEEFGIQIEDHELNKDLFRSLGRVVDLVLEKVNN